MHAIKPVFKNLTPDVKSQFKTSQCLLLISVGQESHEGERFSVTVDLINSAFNSCVLLLYDSLQRHTMALNSTKEPYSFHETAVREGDLWLERNKKFYDKLTILKEITRWDFWLNHPNYFIQQNKLKKAITEDPIYCDVFEKTIDNYLSRYVKRLNDFSSFDNERARRMCFDYLLEECTVLCLWSELNCQFEIYPNRHNDAIEETRKKFILPQTPNLLRPIRLGFRNAKQIEPQLFRLLQEE